MEGDWREAAASSDPQCNLSVNSTLIAAAGQHAGN